MELESEEPLNSSQEGGRISLPVSGKGGGEARVPLSSGTVCVPYFACRESLHQTWALGQPGCWAECGDVAGRRSKGGRGKPPSGILKTWHMHTVRQGIGCGCWGITITVIIS